MSLIDATPHQFRLECRSQNYKGQTSGFSKGYAQANLVILPKLYAFDFLLFCQRNPKPCPLLEVLEPGIYAFGNDIDVRTDLPKYRVYTDGVLINEIHDISDIWSEDFVTFVIGCSFSFEDALVRRGLKIRHIEMDKEKTVPMYRTNVPCKEAGIFKGNLVVSMRPFAPQDAILATQITSRFPKVHGAPVHIGNPSDIGIMDISKPDFGDSVYINPGEIPVFWACGVTPQAVVMESRPSICITHAPGHMLILDSTNESLSM
jgi:uncharacterized protein YcsI (UPF0317 family)